MEIIAATDKWNKDVKCSFTIAIIPLTFSFIGIAIFKIMEIIWFCSVLQDFSGCLIIQVITQILAYLAKNKKLLLVKSRKWR